MIGPTNQLLAVGGDPVPDTDSGSLFHFPHHRGIADVRKLVSITHAITHHSQQPIFTALGEMPDADDVMNPHFGSDPAVIRGDRQSNKRKNTDKQMDSIIA